MLGCDAPSNKPLIILVDQFEETWTLCQPADPKNAVAAKRAFGERAIFVRTLMHAAAEPNGQVIVPPTSRSDFFGVTAEFPEMNRAIATGNEIVPVMSKDELRAAIAEPARVAGRPVQGRPRAGGLGKSRERISACRCCSSRSTEFGKGFGRR